MSDTQVLNPPVSSRWDTGREAARDVALLLLVGALVNLPFLGQEHQWESRELRHASIALEMAADGDFLVPHLLGQPYIYKPPVLHAPVAMLYRLCGGPSIFLARLPSAVAGILCAVFLYGLGRLFCDRRVGLWGGLILLATPAHAVLSRTARPDMLFTLALVACVYGLVAGMAETGGWRRAATLAFGGLCAGLAVLAKGPYGVVYPLLFTGTVVLLAPLGREGLKRPRVHEWLGFGLALLVIPLAWGVPVYLRDSGAYLREVFGQHNAATGAHVRPFYYYLGPGLKMALPWALLLPWMVGEARIRSALPRITGVIFLALSCVPSKRWHYLGPWYPLFALWAAATVARWEAVRWRALVARAVLVLMLAAPPVYYGVALAGRRNPDLAFAERVAASVPHDAVVLTFPGMVEELNYVGRVHGRIPGGQPGGWSLVLLTETPADVQPRPSPEDDKATAVRALPLRVALETVAKTSRPCFLAANRQNLARAAAAGIHCEGETVIEMRLETDPQKASDPGATWVLLRLR